MKKKKRTGFTSMLFLGIALILTGCGGGGGGGTSSGGSTDTYKSGSLDPTFNSSGTPGIVTYNSGSYRYIGNSITTDADGNILVTGLKYNGMAIWKYKTDGTLDTTFNKTGIVTGGSSYGDYGSSIITTAKDGNILVTGSNHGSIYTWRYNTDGTRDTAFDTGSGYIVTDGSSNGLYGPSITTDANGILVTGSIKNSIAAEMAIWKYKTDGTPDIAFNKKGIVIYNSRYGYGYSITTDANRILVTGKVYIYHDNGWYYDMAIWRYKTDGTLDTAFGKGGIVTGGRSPYGNSYGKSITTDADGNILITGSIYNGRDYDMAIWRYKTDGILDENFGTNGIAIYNGGHNDSGNSITTAKDGNILVTGSINNGSAYYMEIWRYNKNGTPDTAFGTGGIVTYKIGNYNSGNSITTAKDGNILVTGFSNKGMAIWRYIP